jgi:hypothetical protein
MDLIQFTEGLARKLFDRHARGVQTATLTMRRNTDADDALLGEAVTLSLPHLPNAQLGQLPTSQRGGDRPFRVIQRSDEPPGPIVIMVDEGTGIPLAITPILIVSQDASDPEHFILVRISPADEMAAAGAQLEFEIWVSLTSKPTDAGVSYTVMDTTSWTDEPHVTRLGGFPPGTIWIRGRCWLMGGGAGDWSAWTSLGQGGGTTLADLIISNVTYATAQLDWTVLEDPATGNVKIEYREVGDPSYSIADSLAPGTETYILGLPTANTHYEIRVVLTTAGVEYGDVLTGDFWTLGGVIEDLVISNITSDGATVSWTSSNNTHPVRVQVNRVASTRYSVVTQPDLLPGSTQFVITGLFDNTFYYVQVLCIDPVTGAARGDGGGGNPLTDAFTTLSSLPTLAIPLNPSVFAGVNPDTGVLDPFGLYGLRVFANPLNAGPHSISFETATETSVGSGTPGAYTVQPAVPAVVGGPTYFIGRAPNTGLLQFIKARSIAPGFTASAYTTPLSVNPWPSTPIPPIGGTLNDLVALVTSGTAEDATDTGSVSFPDGAKLYKVNAPSSQALRLRLYKSAAARDADISRARDDYNFPGDLLLDTEVGPANSYETPVYGDVTILLAVLGDLVVYWSLTNYETTPQDLVCQIFYSVPSRVGTTPGSNAA